LAFFDKPEKLPLPTLPLFIPGFKRI